MEGSDIGDTIANRLNDYLFDFFKRSSELRFTHLQSFLTKECRAI